MKKLNNYLLFIHIVVLTLLTISCGPWAANDKKDRTRDYANEVKSAASVFKWDLKDYYFRSTPVGNFGVGTMYLKENKKADARSIESSWLLASPSTWFATTLSEKDKQQLLSELIIPGDFGNFGITSTRSFTTSAAAELPIISNLLSTSASVDITKGLSLSFTADSAINRRLVWPDFAAAMEEKKFRKPVLDAFQTNNYYIAAADIVFTNFKVNINVDKSVNPELHAKLNEAVGKVIGKDATGSLSIHKVSDDKFTAVASRPVVVAVLFKEPPKLSGKGPGENPNPSEWKNANVKSEELRRLEDSLAK